MHVTCSVWSHNLNQWWLIVNWTQCIRQISHNASLCNRNVHTCAQWCIMGYLSNILWDFCKRYIPTWIDQKPENSIEISHAVSEQVAISYGNHFMAFLVIELLFLPEASFGLRVLSLPASVCVCMCLSVRQSRACLRNYSWPVSARITKFGPQM